MRKTSIVTVVVAVALAVPLSVYASHQFTDVPSSNQFHNAIDWMKDNNITVGCNPPSNTRYCPNDSVTRGQMAAFMKRLAENQVVDAGTLDGLNGSAYVSPIWGAAIDSELEGQGLITAAFPVGNNILSLPVSPPATGVMAVTFRITVASQIDAHYLGGAWLQYDNATCDVSNRIPATVSYYDSVGPSTTDYIEQVGTTIVKDTTGGNHTVYMCSGNFTGAVVRRLNASIVAVFSASGLATASAAGDMTEVSMTPGR
jgi:hypothetical protein